LNSSLQVVLIRKQLTAQYARQDVRMQEFKSLLRDKIKEQLAEKLRPGVNLFIGKKIEEIVKERVHKQVSHACTCRNLEHYHHSIGA
jgi:hypothetical protein